MPQVLAMPLPRRKERKQAIFHPKQAAGEAGSHQVGANKHIATPQIAPRHPHAAPTPGSLLCSTETSSARAGSGKALGFNRLIFSGQSSFPAVPGRQHNCLPFALVLDSDRPLSSNLPRLVPAFASPVPF